MCDTAHMEGGKASFDEERKGSRKECPISVMNQGKRSPIRSRKKKEWEGRACAKKKRRENGAQGKEQR